MAPCVAKTSFEMTSRSFSCFVESKIDMRPKPSTRSDALMNKRALLSTFDSNIDCIRVLSIFRQLEVGLHVARMRFCSSAGVSCQIHLTTPTVWALPFKASASDVPRNLSKPPMSTPDPSTRSISISFTSWAFSAAAVRELRWVRRRCTWATAPFNPFNASGWRK